jgi:glutathione synthase/RimK-type ligase-like ATP-grasp enzyme
MSIAGESLLPFGQDMMAAAAQFPEDATLWMNLSTVMQCLGQREGGLSIQAQALQMQRIYHLAAQRQPATLRLLILAVAGDLAANTPLDCLLEDSSIDMDFYYVSPGTPLAEPVPDHDVLVVAIGESQENRALLVALEHALADWPRPVINAPRHIPATGRDTASMLLRDAPGLRIPPTHQVSRATLMQIATGQASLTECFEDCDFPLILRPLESQAGRDLERITCARDITTYLARVSEEQFFVSRFVDYSGADGLFRKYRIALVDGHAFACHMAVSSHWMVHYVNAGMYQDAAKRAEEAAFMQNFGEFSQRHRQALAAIHQRTGLDYVCVDCAETREGQLLIFEVDHAMVVHAMDSEALFPYKAFHMRKVEKAFIDLVVRRVAAHKPVASLLT